MRNMIKPPPSPISGGGAGSLSAWFRDLDNDSSGSPSECSSLSIPFAELAITYMDDTSDTTSNYQEDEDNKEHDGISQACASMRGECRSQKKTLNPIFN